MGAPDVPIFERPADWDPAEEARWPLWGRLDGYANHISMILDGDAQAENTRRVFWQQMHEDLVRASWKLCPTPTAEVKAFPAQRGTARHLKTPDPKPSKGGER
jgi:hypothetical protein